ncbi:MAG: asparagine synthase-related protein [Armatimonadota bacterium]|jgi:asparagine synthase (glutamine-hydrolysing)
MSGIAGVIGENASTASVSVMLEALRHRGPDGQWTGEVNECALGACTSDLGPEKGTGHARDDTTVLVFDGEIYNERPEGTSDAQVALELYQQHGRLFAAHLHGAFACAVCDDGDLVLARDSVGIRPLYWGEDDEGSLHFASECKALARIVTTVQELSPATVFSLKAGVQSYLPVYPPVSMPGTVEEAKLELRRLLFGATERRLADGAVGGALLSGGLDSSIIAAIAHELKPDLKAFTVGIEGAADLENAACMADYLGIEHTVQLFGPQDIKQLVPTAVYALESFDEDCVSGAIANLVASELAFKETNCILSGEGGDELNGGYLLLKDLPNDEARRRTMDRLIDVAYNTALQRLDRAMMYNSINYRTPLLDTEVTAFCLQMPVGWKVHPNGDGRFVEKWLLREAFRDMLPEPIYRREKLRFSGGTGTDPAIESISDEIIARKELTDETRDTPSGYHLNSPKELHYYRIFQQHFPPCFESLVGRWDPDK